MIADNCCRNSSNRPLVAVVATGETVGVGQTEKSSARAYIFRFALNSDAVRRSLTVHSGLDFFDPDQGSPPPWAHTEPGPGHGYGSAPDSRDRGR
jgi:hypothetical protein